ncbi:MAG: HEAT repeat domain-containing protein [Nitrospira sp.]|nr:HEAT repeat domain-containing protein [Nitrospira sp.]
MNLERTQKAAALLSEGRTRGWDQLHCALSALLPEAIGVIVRAYHEESDTRQRESLLHLLWEFRDPAAIPTLAEALKDPSDRVWKEALDGLVTLGTPSLSYLEDARNAQPQSSVTRQWLDEAIKQIQGNQIETSE